MVVLSYTIVSDLENHGIQFSANPSHDTVLFRDLAALVNAVRLTKTVQKASSNPTPRFRFARSLPLFVSSKCGRRPV
jgi:hypothetical protein